MKRITQVQWMILGGLSNPKLYRRMVGGQWCYWQVMD